MNFQYLGTAASEGWPSLFCECDHCERARKAGGKNIRKRSQAIIDGRLLLDFPADSYVNLTYSGIRPSKINTCLITHAHCDHFAPEEFFMRAEPYAHINDKKPLDIYCMKASIDKYLLFNEGTNPYPEDIVFHEIKPYEQFEADGYTITALPADHAPSTDPVNYIISKNGKTMLYAHDTGYPSEDVWQFISDKKFRFDFVSLDCTNLLQNYRRGHMDITACADVKQRMTESGLADGKTIFAVSHFSHNGGLIHDELVPVMAEYNILVGYDGMKIDF